MNFDHLNEDELRQALTFIFNANERLVKNNVNFVAVLEIHRGSMPQTLQDEVGKYVEAQNKVIATTNEALGVDKNKLN